VTNGGKFSGAEAINSSKCVIAFYRFLSLQFCAIFSLPNLVGDGVYLPNYIFASSNALFFLAA